MLLIIIAHALLRFSFLPEFNMTSYLSLAEFLALSLSIILVAASGNMINDIFDIETDFVNKKQRPLVLGQIKISKVYLVYSIFNLIAISISIYISYIIQNEVLFYVEIGVVFLLYCYARYLKHIPLLGNVLISVLVSMAFVLVAIVNTNFEFVSWTQAENWLMFYVCFAFWTNLNREVIKDVIDIKGDYAQKFLTLPILLGKSRINTVLFVSSIFLIGALLIGVNFFLNAQPVFVIYIIFGICFPLLFVLYKIGKHETQVNYALLSNIYKFVLLIGLCSILLFEL